MIETQSFDEPLRHACWQDGQPPSAEVERKREADSRTVGANATNDHFGGSFGWPLKGLGARHGIAHGGGDVAGHDDRYPDAAGGEQAAQGFAIRFDARFAGTVRGRAG